MARRVDIVLEEILEAITLIESAISGRDIKAIAADKFLQFGVERGLEIISEAVRHLPEELLTTRPEINWSDIRAFGNFVRHEYWRVDAKIVWRVVGNELPALRTAIAAMLPERRVELTADLPNAEIDAVEAAQMAPGSSHLNTELDQKR
jgi:uncharacterized protein with HEPN domain